MKNRIIIFFVLLSLLSSLTGCNKPEIIKEKTSSIKRVIPSLQENQDIDKYKLDNGITVITKELSSSPVIAINIVVHVGSKNENDKTRGLSHIQEHMLFKGTKKYKAGEISRTIESVGGKFNAYTNYDATVYYITLPKDSIKTGIDILSSIMYEATIDETELNKELEVVMEELRRENDNPERILQKELFKIAFTEHPYKHPIIGYEDTVQNITQAQVKDFYNKWYIPENMTVVVVGDFDKDILKKNIDESFGLIEKRENKKQNIPVEPAQNKLNTVIIKKPIMNTYLSLGFRNTSFDHPDTPALDLLYAILGNGNSSRLVQKLRENKKIVTRISTQSYTPEDPGFGFIDVELEASKIKLALREILKEVYILRDESVTDNELKKAKLYMESKFIYAKENYNKFARKLGFYELIGGGVEKQKTYLDSINKITADDIKKVAKKYITSNNLNIGILYPEQETQIISEEEIMNLNKEIEQNIINIINSNKSGKIVDQNYDDKTNVTKISLDNGLKLLIREDSSIETVGIKAVFLGGLRFETTQTNGINYFLSEMLTRGTKNRNQEDIKEDIDQIAATLKGFSGRNSFGLTAHTLSKYNEEILEILSDVIKNSIFPLDQIETTKTLILDKIKRQADIPFYVTFNSFTNLMYEDHPYSMTGAGTTESVQNIERKDLIAYSKKYLNPQNLTISIVGDVNTEKIVSQIQSTLGKWNNTSNFSEPKITNPTFENLPKIKYLPRDLNQSSIMLGFPGFTLDSKDRYAFAVTNKILSGMGGKLFRELRDKRSLAYSVNSFRIEGYKNPGFFAVYMGTEPSKTNEAINGIKQELKNFIDQGISDEELKNAIDYLVGSFAIDLQTFSSQADKLAFSEIYGLGYDDYAEYIENIKAVTKEDVQNVSRKYIDFDKYVLSVVGPQDIE